MITIDFLLLIGAVLLLLSILFAKAFQNLGIPTMLIFIGVGMLAGSEGIGGIYFDDAKLTQSIGIVALMFILFSGGLDTDWPSSRAVLAPSFVLATIGVFLTAIIVGFAVMLLFDTSFRWGFLVGSIVSSTDAAAVFSVMRAGNIRLKGRIKPLLELESGSNDPMAIFLTIGTIELLLFPEKPALNILWLLIAQMGLGGTLGLLGGKLMTHLVNRLKFSYEGIYPVFALALAILVYSFTANVGGSGFLAIYIAGIVMGNKQFIQKRSLIRFFDGLAVLSQISMFLTLGLLVFPSEIGDIWWVGLLISAILIFIARPLSVFLTMMPFRFSFRENLFTSWVGLRGAVPIILATFPLIMGIENSDLIFNIVFFVVLTSALLQGWSLNPAARLLGLAEQEEKKKSIPLEFISDKDDETVLEEVIIPFNSGVIGKQLAELEFPDISRVVLIVRSERNIIPTGKTELMEGDVLLILIKKSDTEGIRSIIRMPGPDPEDI